MSKERATLEDVFAARRAVPRRFALLLACSAAAHLGALWLLPEALFSRALPQVKVLEVVLAPIAPPRPLPAGPERAVQPQPEARPR
ncbi:MAG TPA: hypothetical protein VNK67_11755, partial [Burkholderiales bacterium]|nr:hypothetical protein [Burkholderiales bacterium]